MPSFSPRYKTERKVIFSKSGKPVTLNIIKKKIPPYAKAEIKSIAAFSLAAGKTGMWIYLFLKMQFDMNSKRYGEENYYVAICDRTNNELRVYINGEEASSEWAITPGGENSCETKTSVWDFKFFQNNLTGEKLDEVMIYDRALSAEEIKNLYDIQKD